MRRLLVLGALLAGALVSAPAASGQILIFDVSGNVHQVSSVQVPVAVSGRVSVDFHGDDAAGCAAARLCDVSGNVTWTPPGPAALVAYGYRQGGRRFEGSFLTFGLGDDSGSAAATSARVHRVATPGAPAGLCADALAPSFDVLAPRDRPGTSTEVALVGDPAADIPTGDRFRTRCAGPSSADLRALLPTHLVSERALRRGHLRLDFSADRPISAGGLAGTLHSDVVLTLGHAYRRHPTRSPPGRTRRVRRRVIEVSYRLERVSGQVVTEVHGLADPDLCGPLDACGLMGSVTAAPRASSGSAQLTAEASIRHSRAELRRAVGLEPGGRPHGVAASGFARWTHEAGTLTASLSRAGSQSGCSDSLPLGPAGILGLEVAGDRVHVSYGEPEDVLADPLRTHCPGPSTADVVGRGALARGSLPLRAFARRRVTLRLTTGRRYSAAGYRGATRPDVTVVLRRKRVRQYVLSYDEPVGVLKRRAR